jgi:glutathione S-transferase/GST-like protein
MRIYWNTRCGSFAPEAVAAEAGLATERVKADYRNGAPAWEELKTLNPMAQVPTVVLDDGQVMTEAAAICLHFAELASDAGLVPPAGTPEKARLLRWLFFMAGEMYPADLLESYPERYTTDPAGADAVRAAGSRRLDKDWQIVEQSLGEGPYLLGETFSVADPFAAMMLAWHREPKALLKRSPKLTRLLETTIARPKIAPLWAEYELGSRL